MARETDRWNELYRRSVEDLPRSPAEVDSVPIPVTWGELPPSEWQANAFLVDRLPDRFRWLDLGCGTGSFLAAFLARHPAASGVGVDASDVAISYGRDRLRDRPELAGRMHLMSGDQRQPAVDPFVPFDLVYALFSLQFLRRAEFRAFVVMVRDRLLAPAGIFAGTVRSTSRSVPASYVQDPAEPGTYISYEPHEAGMVYHHYSADEILEACATLGGRIVHLEEKHSRRDYDPAPNRAWWDFVIVCP